MTQSVIFGVVPTGSGAQVRGDFNSSDQCEATEHAGTSAPSPTYQYMKWRNSSTLALYRRNAANSGWEIIDWFATSNPTATDDTADGFVIGSRWMNTSGNLIFLCTNPAAGAATWTQVGIAPGGSVTSVFGRGGTVTAQSGDYTAAQIAETAAAKVMTSTERTKLAAINTFWADRLSSDPATIVKNVSLGAHDLRQLLIFYGTPLSINGVSNADYAAGQLARFDDVVLGYGLQDTGHANYASTVSIITKAKALNPRLTIWGNIDVGVSGGTSHNHSTGTLQTHIDQWVTAGANGIFCDNFGYDRGVTRARQNTIVAYVHTKTIGAMLYSTTITDALSPAIVATYNASGTATVADSRDAYLADFSFNSDTISSPYFISFATMKQRGDDMRTWRTTLGVRMFASNVLVQTGTGQTVLDEYRGIAESLAHIFRLNGYGVSAAAYSASGTDTNKVSPYSPKVSLIPGGRLTAAYSVNGSNTEIQAPDLGVIVHYESGQYTWTAPGQQVGGGGSGTAGDSGLIPTAVQTANGNPPNAERVILKGSVSDVSLLTAATQRHAQLFYNATSQTVNFTSSETIVGYPGGFGLPSLQAVNFVRDPDDNSILAL